MSIELQAEAGNRVAQIHVNRLRMIFENAVEKRDLRDSAFPDNMRMLANTKKA